MAITTKDFETIEALTLQHRAFDPFIRAELAGRSVQLDMVNFIMDAVVDGSMAEVDITFQDMNEED